MTNTNPTIDLDKLATLSQLSLDDAERAAAGEDLVAIIAMIDSFADANVEETEPMSHPLDLHASLRTDTPSPAIDRDAFQALAPVAEEGLYLVPQVIDSNG